MSKHRNNTIEIRNLPPETDEPTLRKMLTSRLSQKLEGANLAANVSDIEMSKIKDEESNESISSEKIKTPEKSRKLRK